MAKRPQTTHIAVHCSATPPSMDIGVYEIDRMHRARGMFRIGYHAVIRRSGLLELGRDWDDVGAHAKEGGFNRKAVGICLIGGVSEKPQKHVPGNPWNGSDAENNFNPHQFTTLADVISELWERYGLLPVIGHRDIPNVDKACPSFSVNDFMKERFPAEYNRLYPGGFPSRWEN